MTIKLPYDIKQTDEKKHVRKKQNSILCIPSCHPKTPIWLKVVMKLMGGSLVGANLSQLSNSKLKKRFESTNLSATVMKQRNDQRKRAHAVDNGIKFPVHL